MALPPLTFVSYISLKNGETKLLSGLTPEERSACCKSMTERSKRIMNEYYQNHPDEYKKLPDYPID